MKVIKRIQLRWISGKDLRHPNELTNSESNKKDTSKSRRLTNKSGAQLESTMHWMLILITCICITKGYRSKDIITLNVLVCKGNFKTIYKIEMN